MNVTSVRIGDAADRQLLAEMLYEAFHWNPAQPRADFEEMSRDVEFAKWVEDFGEREGDVGFVAETALAGGGAEKLGAAWYRSWTSSHHSYGFVAADVPELAIGIVASARGRGIGRSLLSALISHARATQQRALSLSADPQNRARTLYEDLGFRKVGESGTSWTLLLELGNSRSR
jgi:ribosomal protein S18 acetylase RimI-like enzyme